MFVDWLVMRTYRGNTAGQVKLPLGTGVGLYHNLCVINNQWISKQKTIKIQSITYPVRLSDVLHILISATAVCLKTSKVQAKALTTSLPGGSILQWGIGRGLLHLAALVWGVLCTWKNYLNVLCALYWMIPAQKTLRTRVDVSSLTYFFLPVTQRSHRWSICRFVHSRCVHNYEHMKLFFCLIRYLSNMFQVCMIVVMQLRQNKICRVWPTRYAPTGL